MSDITYARKCDDLMDVATETVPERLLLALTTAVQAVARADREIDGKLKYVADRIATAVRPDEKPERWITWGDPGQRVALAVHRIETFSETEQGTFLTLINGDEIDVPLTYGQVAFMVGAV
jgi:hypothetical protein